MINPIRAVFVGDGSLLVRCAEAFLEAGHEVVCIASADPAVLSWAQDQGLAFEQVQGLAQVPRFEGADFEVLFSIGWLHRLPPALLARAHRLALNFHDGPLPRHGGLNAPAWALLEGCRHHGVTWHEMTPALDAGRIACELTFDLSPDETAFSLNTHCYEAGFRSFLTLVDLLASNALALRSPAAPPRLHGRHHRPSALATLDWRRTAAELAAQCRALDFGPTPNPLACPKLWCAGRLLRVASAQAEAVVDASPVPGCVLAQQGDRLWLATVQGTLRLEGLVALDGGPLPTLVPGEVLAPLSVGQLQRLADARPAMARGEAAWRSRLLALAAEPLAELPHPRRDMTGAPEACGPGACEADGASDFEVSLPVDPVTCAIPGHVLLAGCAAWLAAVSGESRAALAWRDPFLAQAAEGLAPHVTDWWPLLLGVGRHTDAADLREAAAECLFLARADGPMTADLRLRLGRPGPEALTLGVCIGPWPDGVGHDAPSVCLMVPALADALPHGRAMSSAEALPSADALSPDPSDLAWAARLRATPRDHGAQTPGPWRLRFDAGKWEVPVAAEIAAQLAAWLPRFARHIGAVGALSLLPPSDLDRIAELHDSAQSVDLRGGLWTAVGRGLARHPGASALEWVGGPGDQVQRLSRAELVRQVTSLARLLRARGVVRGEVVGVCLPRGPQLLVSVLAVLACGGAYLPLDPDYPADRLRLMCHDAGLQRVIGGPEAAALLGVSGEAVISPVASGLGEVGVPERGFAAIPARAGEDDDDEGDEAEEGEGEDQDEPAVPSDDDGMEVDVDEDGYGYGEVALPDDLAYLIYTSGSTGLPKGVRITQGSVLNFFAGMDAVLAQAPQSSITAPIATKHTVVGNPAARTTPQPDRHVAGRWLAVTSLSFDISVLELLWTLARGFTVVLHGVVPATALGAAGGAASGAAFDPALKTAAAGHPGEPAATTARMTGRAPQWSLFHFASQRECAANEDAGAAYRLLIDAACFADTHGFAAVWTPERHFHGFGGPFPNPALLSAALAMVTRHVQLRAGSCVLPLHHPLTVAEDWALVDRLSGGRVGVSFAAGWQPQDFVLAPAAWAGRRQQMFEGIDAVRRLWRGEALTWPGPEGQTVTVRTLPRPVQAQLPVWVTVAGNPQTFAEAGRAGCHVLTHLLGQSVQELADKVAVYRAAWDAAGHSGRGQVALMLHTFVGEDEDEVREMARGPLKAYLREAMDLIRRADWRFPTFATPTGGASPATPAGQALPAGQTVGLAGLVGPSGGLSEFAVCPPTQAETEALLDHAFERYWRSSALIGTPERCMGLVAQLAEIGVYEIACLIDFGIPGDQVLAHLPDLHRLTVLARTRLEAGAMPVARPTAHTVHAADTTQATQVAFVAQSAGRALSVGAALTHHRITHLQCTPSQAAILLVDEAGRQGLSGLSALLVGGEALPPTMASALRDQVPGLVLNMYGPTEATVWCSAWALPARAASRESGGMPGDMAEDMAGESSGSMGISLGRPLANTELHLRNAWGQECPAFVPGELCVSGACLAQGYHARPVLDAERFVADPLRSGRRLYRSGDQVRREPDGRLAFLGRLDHQVKIRGHRIELGEIESALASMDGVREAVVVACRDGEGEAWLQAFVTPRSGQSPQPLDLARALGRQLPEFMLPRGIALRDDLPKTPNGKIDRQALVAASRTGEPRRLTPSTPMHQLHQPNQAHQRHPSRPAPALVASTVTLPGRACLAATASTPQAMEALEALEAVVTQTWRAVLGRQEVGREINFFDLGGHSLAVIQVQRRLRDACGVEIPVTDMFRLTTISSLARHLAANSAATAATLAASTFSAAQGRAGSRRALRNSLPG